LNLNVTLTSIELSGIDINTSVLFIWASGYGPAPITIGPLGASTIGGLVGKTKRKIPRIRKTAAHTRRLIAGVKERTYISYFNENQTIFNIYLISP